MESREAYLRIGELARRTGTSPELLRAWEQRYGLLRPSRSDGGFRLYSDQDEKRVLRAKALIAEGLSASEAARQALAPSAPGRDADASLVQGLATELRDCLDRFDEGGANQALDRLFAAFSVETAMQDVLLPYLHLLGSRWASGDATIAQEHFASSLIRGRLLGLARGWGSGDGPSLLLACPPGEEHDLGLIMFGIAAWRLGWHVTYLGQDTPFDTIREAVAAIEPPLVVLAVSEGTSLDEHATAIRSLVRDVPVAVGGVVRPEQASALGLEILEGDPIEAASALRSAHDR